MRTLFALVIFCAAAAAGRAIPTSLSESTTHVDFDFALIDDAVSPGAASDLYIFTVFPGSTLSFFFRDRAIVLGDQIQFATNPSSGTYEFIQNGGELDFAGAYLVGTTLVNWSIESTVTIADSGDTWKGRFAANVHPVPDSGSTLALLGLGLVGLTGLHRRLSRHGN